MTSLSYCQRKFSKIDAQIFIYSKLTAHKIGRFLIMNFYEILANLVYWKQNDPSTRKKSCIHQGELSVWFVYLDDLLSKFLLTDYGPISKPNNVQSLFNLNSAAKSHFLSNHNAVFTRFCKSRLNFIKPP